MTETGTTTAGGATTAANPYVGPRSLRQGEPIYGRARELYELQTTLVAQRVVLLYSPSGAGKTSLVEAGVRVELERRDFEVSPTIRVGYELPDGAEGDIHRNRYVVSAITCLEERRPAEARLTGEELAGLDFADYLDRFGVGPAGDRDPCLIFDQFEELFTLDPTDFDDKAAFLADLGVALRDQGRWALVAMREDFIAQLDPYLGLIPGRLATRYRLDLLGPEAARAAAQQPAAEVGVHFTDEAATVLIDDLRRVRIQRGHTRFEELGPNVEPVQLQVVCRQLFATLDPSARSIELDDVVDLGNVDDALGGFYVQQIRDVAARTGATEREIRDWFDEELITESGFRTQVLDGPPPHGSAVLRGLEDAHLIRAERRRGTAWYELAHDRLIEPVRASNAAWRDGHLSTLQREARTWERQSRPSGLLLTGATLAGAETWSRQHPAEMLAVDREFLEASLEQQHRADLERRAARRKVMAASTIGAVALVALVVVCLLWLRTTRAERDANAQRLEAVRQAELADEARAAAEDSAADARAREMTTKSLTEENDPRVRLGLALEAELGPKQVFAESRDAYVGALQRLDVAKQPSLVVPAHDGSVFLVAWSPDDAQLFSAGVDQTAHLWNAATGEEAAEPVEAGAVPATAVAASPDLATVATGDATGTVRLFSVSTGLPVEEPVAANGDRVLAMQFSTDGRRLATAGVDGSVGVIDVATGQPLGPPLLTEAVVNQLGLAWSPDGSRLALAGASALTIWDAASGTPVAPVASSAPVDGVFWSPDGSRIATLASEGNVVILDSATATPVGVPIEGEVPFDSVAWSPDGRHLAISSIDGTIRIVDPTGGLVGDGVSVPGAGPSTLAWSPGGTRLASGGSDGTIRVWEPWTDAPLLVASDRYSYEMAWTPRGDQFAVASSNGVVHRWEAASGEPLVGFETAGVPVQPSSGGLGPGPVAALSPDASTLAEIDVDGALRLWDVDTGEPIGSTVALDRGQFTRLLWAPDGTALASIVDNVGPLGEAGRSAPDSAVDLWRLAGDGSPSHVHVNGPAEGIAGVAWSPDGDRLAISFDDVLQIWDAQTGEAITEPFADRVMVSANSWSPDGSRLATVNSDAQRSAIDGTVQLWDPATAQHEGPALRGSTGTVLAWSPDGDLLAGQTFDGSIGIWGGADGEPLQFVKYPDLSMPLAATWSPDGAHLAVGYVQGAVQLFDADAGVRLGAPLAAGTGVVGDVSWSPDGTRLAATTLPFGVTSEPGVTTVRMWRSFSEEEACALLSDTALVELMIERIGAPFVCADAGRIANLPPLPVVPLTRPLTG